MWHCVGGVELHYGTLLGTLSLFSNCDVVWETGTKFVPQNIPIVQFESHRQPQGRSLTKKFIYQMKTSLQRSCDRCDPVCDNIGWETSFFKGWFPYDRYDSSVCWTISSYLGEHMETRRTLHYHFLDRLSYISITPAVIAKRVQKSKLTKIP